MAVHPRRRDEGGETLDELERGEGEPQAPRGRRLRQVVEQTLRLIGVTLQALERQRTPGAVAKEALQTGALGGLHPHAGIDREAAAVLPGTHRLGLLGLEQSLAHCLQVSTRARTFASTRACSAAPRPVTSWSCSRPSASAPNTPSMTQQW
jgi:hypothetical protein